MRKEILKLQLLVLLRFGGTGFDFGYTAGNKSHPRSNSLFFSISEKFSLDEISV